MIIQGTRDFVIGKAASFLAMAVQVCISLRGRAVIGIDGGDGVAEILAQFAGKDLPWERIHFFQLEEHIDPVACSGEIGGQLACCFEHLAGKELIHRFRVQAGSPVEGAREYMADFARYGGRFDLILASCREDGRIASLFPNHQTMAQHHNGFVVIEDAPESPMSRMTASCELIRQADTGILLALGSSRRAALHNFFDAYLSDAECPAKLMSKLQRYYLLTDQDVG